ncbi:hypothetical protein R3P38DRAFT_2978717 [Favolaschia claudopus]|uniref:Uncharacterized protein n=1 Tax=Favolaschia claudopus TaxID=2862362 RepID=A0AAW0B0B2_9AGAR
MADSSPPYSHSPSAPALSYFLTDVLLNEVSKKLAALPIQSTPATPTPHSSMANNDVQMPQGGLGGQIVCSRVPWTHGIGWTAQEIRNNHTDEIVALMDANPDSMMVAVFLASCFLDRASGPAAVKELMISVNVIDAADIDVFPPTPKSVSSNTDIFPLGRPLTHPIAQCSDGLKAAVAANNGLFMGSFGGRPMAFYCLPVRPEPTYLVCVFTGISSLTPFVEIYNAFLARLCSDQAVLDIIAAHRSNVHGELTAQEILATLFDAAKISFITARRRVNHTTVNVPAVKILLPPPDLDPRFNEQLHRFIMDANFSFIVPLRGVATPWLGSNPAIPRLMQCNECYAMDHYRADCPIVNSNAYRTIFGLPLVDDNVPADAPTLAFVPTAPTPAQATAAFRGAGRGIHRGGGRGGNFRGRGRGAANHGFAPYP